MKHMVPGLGGIDEAGRGPLAGPVVAAVVVLFPGQRIDGVKDSKQLSPGRREELAEAIRREAMAWALGRAEVEEIDTLNILQATMLAMRRAVDGLKVSPEVLRFDGNRAPELTGYPGATETLVRGDRICAAIAAASVLAKVHRDRLMNAIDREFPAYGFARHKGYPTQGHRDALMALGPCAVHRRSFRPVKVAMSLHGRTA